MVSKKLLNVHPGEILQEEFLDPMGISGYRLSKETGIPESKISDIIHGKRNITASISIKLGKFFDLNPHFWIGLQNDYDIREEQHKLAKVLKSMKSYRDFYKDQDSKKVTPSLA
ncbi:HigA family addiction module antitoxin [Leptospira sp. id769339]|uniref:HigA family addiction module antitoxin n=1 Tax=Leptospira sp. id769339 TaxID=2864221 RepID=UPI00214B3AB4|nr:HigA family addiction module antitoxin [Leptospira sp. id769339]MCR1795745.1 HigA family addiction module antidote protein [Leptospira sp. id769339]